MGIIRRCQLPKPFLSWIRNIHDQTLSTPVFNAHNTFMYQLAKEKQRLRLYFVPPFDMSLLKNDNILRPTWL
ncbi:unnamed protein product [Fusarium graminearum]|nr:unnamed protein product [Fusarium graminearum]CAG1963202.1 unnamed protein product [Fusarium graminearum]VTO84696.1 unnamed protein product [Fusarium graminearum]